MSVIEETKQVENSSLLFELEYNINDYIVTKNKSNGSISVKIGTKYNNQKTELPATFGHKYNFDVTIDEK